MGCDCAPWTGSLIMKQSAMLAAADAGTDQKLDMDAPPDVFAAISDHKKRGLMSLQEALKGCTRIFVCGLALDFCVLDTCLNAANPSSANPMSGQVYMVLDAARAAHIPGFGQFGSGFLSDPLQVLSKMVQAGVQRTSVEALTGEAPYGFMQMKSAFPRALGPLVLDQPSSKLELKLSESTYQVVGGLGHQMAEVERMSSGGAEGRLSPRTRLPPDWPGAKNLGATRLGWAYPLDGIAQYGQGMLAVTTSPALMFIAYGGFLLLDDSDRVLSVQVQHLPRSAQICPDLPRSAQIVLPP